MGEQGDFGRRSVLDPVMLKRATPRAPKTVLDVGCGEGRFCRMLKQPGIEITGLDPTNEMLAAVGARDGDSEYVHEFWRRAFRGIRIRNHHRPLST